MPPQVKTENHRETRFGQLLRAAINAKTAELQQTGIPGTYTHRQLGADAGISFSYVSKILHGRQQPSEEIVDALIHALDPYLPADEARMAAGYMPHNNRLRRLLRRIARYPIDRVEGIDRTLQRVYFRDMAAIEDDELLYTFDQNASDATTRLGQRQ